MKNVNIKSRDRGITLISLVVTVIVLIILAGITFSTLLGEHGALNLARNEKEIAQKRLAKEKLRIEVAGSKKNNGAYVAQNIENSINAHLDNKQVLRHQFPMIVEVDGYKFAIDYKGRILDVNFDYLVEFDGNGAVGTMNSQEFLFDTEKNLETNKFSREGYTFVCWNTQPDGNGIKFDNEELVSNLTEEEYGVIVLYAQWVKGVAETNGVYYDSLQEAIDAVPSNNVRTTVKLLTNTKENISIIRNQNILLDLQNHTINVRDYGNSAVVENNGTIEITNGTIRSDSLKTATINNNSYGKLTISGGKILMEATAGKQALYNNGGTVEITGTAYLISASSNDAGENKRATVQNQANSTLNITGGTIISINHTGIQNNGIMTIGKKDGNVNTNSPVIQGANIGINCNSDTTFNFYDGIAKGKTKPINDISYVADKEIDYLIASADEIIAGETYRTAYLSTAITKVKVTFNPNEGVIDGETTKEVLIGQAIGGPLPTATKDGYAFVGWFSEITGGEQLTEETKIGCNITYYAHWLPIFTVNFDVNATDGSLEETSRSVISGYAIGELPIPIRNKYDFIGWFTTKTGGVQINEGTQINANNITYYAHWKKTMYAKIGDQEYETVAKAINAITDSTETTITITKDTNENITIKSGQNIVLDIGNNTLNANTNAAVITNNGNLKIISGTVASTQATGTINNNKTGTLTIDGGIITGKERSAVYNDGGTVIIQGDSYLESSAKGNAPDSSGMPLERATINNINGGKVTITGGTIVGINNAAVCNDASTLTVGVKDGNVSITSPVLIGNTYGIKNGAKSGKTYTFNLYDGIAGGITGGADSGIVQQVDKNTISRPGTITDQEVNTQMASGTKTINGKTYKTNYLEPIQ